VNQSNVVSLNKNLCPVCHLTFNGQLAKCPCDGAQLIKILKPRIESTIVPGYRLLDQIGQGGTGLVYKAVKQATNEIVAIKILHLSLVNDLEMVRRFKQEADLTMKLSSENVVSVKEYGVVYDGRPYLVMEYLEGFSLGSWMNKAGALDPLQALPAFIQVASGLAHIHEQGIAHRDIKPNNIMLSSWHAKDNVVKIVDFGIAKKCMESSLQAVSITSDGETIGSPLYMSPEQCLGRPVNHQTDIYSLGVVMYEALTGRPPFIDRNTVKIMSKHAYEAPAPMGLGQSAGAEGIEYIIMRALAKRPGDRYELVTHMKSELQFCLYRMQMEDRAAKIAEKETANATEAA